MSDITESPAFKLAFDIARRLPRDPGFRKRLDEARGLDGTPLLPAVYDETVKELTDRMTHYDKGLIVIEDDTEPEGVRLIWWEKR